MKKVTTHLTFLILYLTLLPFSYLFNSELFFFLKYERWLKIIIIKYIFEVNNF